MLKLEYKPYTLDFKFVAGTSRGKMTDRMVWFIQIADLKNPQVRGIGEVAPLPGLSIENIDLIPFQLEELKRKMNNLDIPGSQDEAYALAGDLSPDNPSVRMGIEMALLDLINGGGQLYFESDFTKEQQEIPINGLIWMGEESFMREQIVQKIEQGFDCIKMKIGAIDFETELKILQFLRSFSSDLIIRVDANGAFDKNNVFEKLDALNEFDIHSIEQPVKKGQWEFMHLVCKKSPIPVALDEELIGVLSDDRKSELLDIIQPQYVILKPSLLGGFAETKKWITIACEKSIGWWITSALESNFGLNAIAQFVAQYPDLPHQGLGTGQLYHNNFDSKTQTNGSVMKYVNEAKNDSPI
jgi:o-succinylbenzoate synthase